jgi:hypothetical protein
MVVARIVHYGLDTTVPMVRITVAVNEPPPFGLRQYTARIRITDEFRALTRAEKRAAILAAVKAVRDAHIDLPVITGDVDI